LTLVCGRRHWQFHITGEVLQCGAIMHSFSSYPPPWALAVMGRCIHPHTSYPLTAISEGKVAFLLYNLDQFIKYIEKGGKLQLL